MFENTQVFVIVLIVILVLLYLNKMYETYGSGSYDIPLGLTTDMDWKGSQISSISTYPNNLNVPSQAINAQIKNLQSYQPNQDGTTSTNWVSTGMKTQSDINNPNNLEGFTLMNPYIPR
jgi:hypothetical protein